ncbi:MAG: hypothetical protein HOO20_22800 [Rhodospirillaceae bacterium]|nr:hypothetical protein [Rhodospirillaceae bacterium]
MVQEAMGGGHRNPASTIAALGHAIAAALAEFDGKDGGYARQQRRDKSLAMGQHAI